MNPQNIRPKKLNIKEFMRLIEEIYSYKFDRKSVNGAAETGPIQNLQEASARFISFKFKNKTKID
jgi:hypothetical protein